MAELHDLAPFYVLDALSPEDAVRFEAHLDTCPNCLLELTEYQGGVEALARSVAEPAPEGMKATVMGMIDDAPGRTGSGPDPDNVVPMFRRWAPLAGLVTVAAALALVFAVGLGRDTSQEQIDSILAGSESVTVEVAESPAQSAEVVYTPTGEAVFTATGLAPLSEGQTYQLWLINADGSFPAGVFVPDDSGLARALVDAEVIPGVSIGLTIEPSGGSATPTGDVLMVQQI